MVHGTALGWIAGNYNWPQSFSLAVDLDLAAEKVASVSKEALLKGCCIGTSQVRLLLPR